MRLRPCMAPWLLGTGSRLGLGSSSLLVARRCSRLPLVVSEAGRQLRLVPFHFRLVGGRDMSGNKRERIEGCPLYPQKADMLIIGINGC